MTHRVEGWKEPHQRPLETANRATEKTKDENRSLIARIEGWNAGPLRRTVPTANSFRGKNEDENRFFKTSEQSNIAPAVPASRGKNKDETRSFTTLEQSNIAPAVPAHVIFKLLAFTAAMIIGPIGTYFLTLKTIFRGNSTLAGATAAFMANVVLIAYVIVAMKEDQSERLAAEEKARKGE